MASTSPGMLLTLIVKLPKIYNSLHLWTATQYICPGSQFSQLKTKHIQCMLIVILKFKILNIHVKSVIPGYSTILGPGYQTLDLIFYNETYNEYLVFYCNGDYFITLSGCITRGKFREKANDTLLFPINWMLFQLHLLSNFIFSSWQIYFRNK